MLLAPQTKYYCSHSRDWQWTSMCSALKYVKKMILSGGCEQRKRYIPVLNRSVEAFYYNETTTIISTRNHNHEIWILDATFCRNFDNHAIPPALILKAHLKIPNYPPQ